MKIADKHPPSLTVSHFVLDGFVQHLLCMVSLLHYSFVTKDGRT